MSQLLLRSLGVLLLVVAGVSVLIPQAKNPRSEQEKTDLLAQGKYIVDRVSKCGDCHTPRNEQGQPDMSRYMRGADMGVEPVVPLPIFNRITPDITAQGLAGWSVEDLAKLFQTGRTPAGGAFRPPMPAYQMNSRDAEAVARYLKSVSGGKK